MKKHLLAITFALGLTSAGVWAGPSERHEPKNTTYIPDPCFRAGEFVVKPFYDITLIDDAPHGHYSDDTLNGGGLAVDYFFTENLGIGVDGYWLDESSIVHSYNVNLTLRAPVLSDCLAVYAIGGGGVFTNGETVGSAHLGGGLEYRFNSCVGVFADGRYKWLDGGDVTLTSVRVGLSFAF